MNDTPLLLLWTEVYIKHARRLRFLRYFASWTLHQSNVTGQLEGEGIRTQRTMPERPGHVLGECSARASWKLFPNLFHKLKSYCNNCSIRFILVWKCFKAAVNASVQPFTPSWRESTTVLFHYYFSAKRERRTLLQTYFMHKPIYPLRKVSGLNSLQNTWASS